jgi:hypothetical protein
MSPLRMLTMALVAQVERFPIVRLYDPYWKQLHGRARTYRATMANGATDAPRSTCHGRSEAVRRGSCRSLCRTRKLPPHRRRDLLTSRPESGHVRGAERGR